MKNWKTYTKKCEWHECGKEFVTMRFWTRFCSSKCRKADYREQLRKQASQQPP